MRPAWNSGLESLRARMSNPQQVAPAVPEAGMPPYMESFLAHLRLLIGVPFDYLAPDSRLLPDESIRFFYIDRSWTDRLVDGAIAVGKIGTREQAHHHAHHPAVCQQLDVTERNVRNLQRGRVTFVGMKAAQTTAPANVVTGFLLRSGAVSGWPHMDVRAYSRVLPPNYDPATESQFQLNTLRLERLSPGVLIALFEGVPAMVVCEEPHHGVQFGVHGSSGQFSVFRRGPDGKALGGQDVNIPVRQANPNVLGVAALRRKLKAQAPPMPDQAGSANFAVELLNLPWRQRFEGSGGRPTVMGSGAFVPFVTVAARVQEPALQALVKKVVL
jgi:hypothetical protein